MKTLAQEAILEIAKKILGTNFNEEMIKNAESYVNSILRDKSRWRLSAVNLERYKENGYLDDKAYVEVLDLAFIPTVFVSEYASTIALSEKVLEVLGVSVSEFLQTAIENTKIIIKNMSDILMSSDVDGDYEDLEGDEKLEDMRVSVDPYMCFGTTLLVNEELLQKTKEEMGNFYIIPSSVHEVILVKADMTDAESLRGMIGEVNTNVLSDEDFLSNNAYYYDGKLQIAA